MARKLKPDRLLFFVTLTLALFGIAMVFSSSVVMAKEKFGDPNYFAFKQLLAATCGLAAMFVVMKFDYHAYRQPAMVFSVLALAVALLVVVFFLSPHAETHRWITLPGFSFQPSELAKVALIIFLAYFLEKRQNNINDIKFTMVPVAIVVGLLAALIVAGRDLGTALSLLFVAATLLFVAGLDLRWYGFSAMLAVPLFYFFVYRVHWRYDRILAFLHPQDDPRFNALLRPDEEDFSAGVTSLYFTGNRNSGIQMPACSAASNNGLHRSQLRGKRE